MGLEEMKEFGLGEMIKAAVDLLNDRLPEAREAARSIANCMYGALTKDEEQKLEAWQNFRQSKLPSIHALSVFRFRGYS
ncbi:hypothetical protein K1719_013542 [Acacia pycnantha]|nr:hypothetical protein K1719_013542 [Acacia pycnantha]